MLIREVDFSLVRNLRLLIWMNLNETLNTWLHTDVNFRSVLSALEPNVSVDSTVWVLLVLKLGTLYWVISKYFLKAFRIYPKYVHGPTLHDRHSSWFLRNIMRIYSHRTNQNNDISLFWCSSKQVEQLPNQLTITYFCTIHIFYGRSQD